MNLHRLAVDRPITTAMALLTVMLFGTIAMSRLPLAWLPEVDAPFIFVEIPYPNSHPEQVERDVVRPVEETLATLSGIKRLRATATADSAEVMLLFDWGINLDVARMQVSEKLDQVAAELPEAAGPVLVYSFNTNDIPVVEGRISAEGVDLSQNYELLEARVLNPLRRLPGVARVDLNGVEPRELYVDLVLDRVKEHAVDVGALVERLSAASVNLVLGQVDEQGLRYTVRSLGAFDSVEELGALVVDSRGLRLADVAEIRYEEPPLTFGRHLDGRYAVALDVYKESTANTVEVVRSVHRLLEEEVNNDPLLAGIELFVWQDQAEDITSGIDGLRSGGLVGALLAAVVLYLFLLRLGPTLLVSLSIPFSIVAACAVMYFSGGSLNVLSMMGLMLGVGMLVDNAIVVLESVDRHLHMTGDRRRAALEGTGQVVMAVTASTATTVIVFLPLVVGSGTELTVWLKEVGLTITYALGCSLVSSLTLIPLVSAHLLHAGGGRPNPAVAWLEARYVRVLAWTLDHRARTFGLLALALVVGVLPFTTGWVKSVIFSGAVNRRLFLSYEFDDFLYKSQAERVVTQVEEVLFAHRDELFLDSVYSFYSEDEAGTALTLSRTDLDDEEAGELRDRIRALLPATPGVRVTFQEEADEGGGSTFFAVRLFGQEGGPLLDLTDEVARRLESADGVVDVTRPRSGGRSEVHVVIDRDRAADLDLTAQDVTRLIGFSLGGVRLPELRAGDREIATWVALRLEDRSRLDDLRQIPVAGRDGKAVLLGDIARFEEVEQPAVIEREDRKVRLAVRGTYEGESWPKARERIEELMNAMALPAGVSWSFNDRVLEQDAQDREMNVNLILALALVYLVMAALFESLAQPLAIFLSIPFAVPGVAWMLALSGTPFNLMAQIGLLILIGVVVNNGILLLDHANHFRRSGLDRHQALLEAGRERLRPILMTALTTVVGLLPLAFGGANVAGLLYYPMARTVMGGLLSSLALTLLVLPNVALGVEDTAVWMRRVWRGAAPSPAPAQLEAATE